MFRFIINLLFPKPKHQITSAESITLLKDTSSFFYNETIKAYKRAIIASKENDEDSLCLARKQFYIAERRHKMIQLDINKFINSKK
jgi:hypothetical protein